MTSDTQAVVDDQNPWPGLDAFAEAAERFFNGRDNETAALRRLVLNAPLTVLFSASGLGKTSLIQAGLFPLLRKEHFLPIRVRLDCRDRSAPLIDQVKQALQDQISALRVDAPHVSGQQTLWQYLHRAGLELWSEQNRLLIPVFVLDQFEEVFTLGIENPTAIAQLLVDLADLVENRIPIALANVMKDNEAASADLYLDSQHYRVLLSFREDFLPAVEGWKRQMPSILRNRLRLLPMTGEQAFKAIHDTAPHLVEESLAWRIVRFVAAAQDDGTGKPTAIYVAMQELFIEPALLSLVCDGLNQKRKAQEKTAFDEALLTGTGQSIVADFYERSVRDLPDRVQRFIENELITERGFRKPCDLDDARSVHNITDEELRMLENRRLVRIEPNRGTDRVELIHDLLTRVVREHRDQQRVKERAEKQRREQRQKAKTVLTVSAIVLLAILSVAGMFLWSFSQRARRAEEQAAKLTLQENVRFNKLATAASLRQEGYNRLHQQKYEDSLHCFRSALGGYEELKDQKDQASSLIDIGDVLALTRNFPDAESAYTQAMRIAKETDERDLEGRALESLAALNERESRLDQALKYYADANELYQGAGDYQASGRVLERLASEAEKPGSPVRAASLYQDALKSYNFAGDQLGKVRVQQALDRILGFWGFLVDLLDGKTYELKPDKVNIGRDVEDVKNDISFRNRMVSRRHMAITRDLHVDDFRSRNGTTINARLLPYGIGAKLSDKDIIVLGNVEPLQFRTTKPSTKLQIPDHAWAILIDDQSKSYRYLTISEYFLTIEDGKLLLRPGSSESAVLRIRQGQGKPQMFESSSEWKLIFTFKETDYEYKTYIMKNDEWVELYDTPLSFVKLSPDGKDISVQGPTFQIVFFEQPPS
jgi:pSer/pThr/pTyr-binding forkhead associated (FHA) protein/tetratricopeptide (TPR) repeat protein